MMASKLLLPATILVLTGAGCGASRQQSYLIDSATSHGAATSTTTDPAAEAESLWAQREDPAMLKAALAEFEKVANAHPERRDVLSRLSRGYYLLAYGHLTEDAEILAAHDAGASWGERILGLRKEFRDRIAAGEDDDDALVATKVEDVPGIYWAYANLGKWSVRKGFTTVLKNKSKLKAFIDRVTELDEKFYYGAGHRGLGAFYAKAPSFAGGDLEKAKAHFEKALAVAPGYFSTKVLMAEYYATKEQDRELFEKLLNQVIAGDPNAIAGVVPIQKIEQDKAKALLAQAEDLFE